MLYEFLNLCCIATIASHPVGKAAGEPVTLQPEAH
jgi:hypothetical protein